MADIDVVVEENDVVLVVFDTEQGPAGPPGTAANTNATFVLVQPATGLPNSAVLQVGAGLLLQSTGGILTISATGAGTGTVTSVGISAPSDLFAVTGSPVTTNGTLALAKQSQSGNLIYASPSGSAGVPTFRNLSANDLAGLFKAGSNVSITGGTTLTIAATGLASGTVTSVGLSLPAIFSTGSAVTSSGNLTASFINQPQAQIFASPASGGSGTPAFRSLTYLDLPLLAGSNIVLTPTGSSYNISAIAGSGTVSSVALAVPGEFTVSGSPITGSGTFTIGKANQNATLVFAGPASGAAAQPTFRAVTYLDLPLLSGPNITLSPSGSNLIISSPSSGSVTSVALSLPNIFNVAGSPITQSGTLSATLVNQAASTFFAGPIIGANNTPLFRAIASSDITQALSGNLAAGSNISITPNGNQFIIATNAGSGIGSVTSVGLSLPNIFNVTGTPVTNSGVLTGTLTNQASASFWAGPISGVSATPSFRPIQGTDLYSIQAGANITLSVVGSALIITSTASGGGGGSVTQVTSGNLTNFATVNVATNTTTPAFTFTMDQAGSGQAFMGPTSGAAAAPGYRNFVLSDLPAGTYTVNSSNVLNNFASGNGTGVLAQNGSTIAFRTITGTANRIVVTNGDGSAGNPTLDLGSSVYTTSSSNTLNNLASSVPTAGQVLIGQTGGTFALATLAAGPGVQINTGSGFTNIAASGALGGTVTSVSGLSPLFTTNNPSTTPTFVQSNASSGAVLIGPQFGSAGNYTFRQLASSDIYGALSTSLVAGSNITLIPNVGTSQITISAAGSSNTNGTVTSVGLSLPSIFSVSGTPVTSSGTLTGTLANQASAYALLGPISGGAAAPTFRPIQSYDLSAIQAGTNVVLSTSGSALIISAAATGGGGVSSVSSGNLSPLFTTSVANPTTAPNLTFTLSNASSGQFFAGPISGSAAAPTFRNMILSDLPSGVFTTSTTGDVTLSSSTGVSAIGTNKVTNAMIRQGVARSVIGVTGNATANVADIQAASANTVLASNTSNTAITFRNIASGDFGANQITPTQIGNNKITMGVLIDGGVNVLTAQDDGQFPIDFPCTITGWTLLSATASGSVTFNVYKSSYSSFPSMSSMVGGGTKPTISSNYKGQNLAISDWSTTSVSTGDVIKFTIESVSGFTQLTIALTAIRTG